MPLAGQSETELLRQSASLERGSEHPLAAAIVAGAIEKGLTIVEAREFRSLTGKGVIGFVDGQAVVLGNRRLLEDLKINAQPLVDRVETLRRDGQR